MKVCAALIPGEKNQSGATGDQWEAPRDVTQFTTQRERPTASEIPANTTIRPPNVESFVVSAVESRKMLFASVERPVPIPVAIPAIPLVNVVMISVTTALILLPPF